jgi:hypothetical protein
MLVASGSAQVHSGSQNAASTSMDMFERALDRDTAVVKSKYPEAQLFQIAIFGLIPKAVAEQAMLNNSMETWYKIGAGDRYVEAIRQTTAAAETAPQIIEKSSRAEPCEKGYPLPGSEVCAPLTGTIAAYALPLKVHGPSELVRLRDWLARAGLDPSDSYDLTITTASQAKAALESAQTSRNLQISSALAHLKPDDVVFSLTDRGIDRSKVGSMIIFDARGEVVGTSPAPKQPLPVPGRR